MDIITAYATKNDCYKTATPLTPKGIVVHSTGANNPNLSRYVDCVEECGVNKYGNHWNNSAEQMGRQVCVHAFIGYDKNKKVRVANILPYNYACWGVGRGSKGSFNFNPVGHIQFEMCEDDLTNKSYCMEVYNVAVEYSAYLCKKFNLDPLGKDVIVSHKEAYALGYGCNHGDPDNWWSKHGLTMDMFRQAVKAKMGGSMSTIPDSKPVVTTTIKAGDLVKISSNAVYYTGGSIPSWVKNQNWYVSSVNGNRVVINQNENKTNAINSAVDSKYLTVVTNSPSGSTTSKVDSTFKKRTTAPSATDKYWIHTSKGGLNECIKINNVTGSCLPNCVAFCWGRFYEITGKRPNLSRANAENWYGYTADGYKRSQTPVPGAVICWSKGKVGVESDGAGHVAIVEEVRDNGDIVTSNSDYGGTRFYMRTFRKANNYYIGKDYTFQGFILPPTSVTQITSGLYKAKVTAVSLNIRKGPGTTYSISGIAKKGQIYNIISEASGKGATKWGEIENGGWISLDYVEKV